ncbi:MAG: hypothetical protein QXR53_05050 [Candidatus Norongarragalinales archaeon]
MSENENTPQGPETEAETIETQAETQMPEPQEVETQAEATQPEPAPIKRGRGRPRKHPKPEEPAPAPPKPAQDTEPRKPQDFENEAISGLKQFLRKNEPEPSAGLEGKEYVQIPAEKELEPTEPKKRGRKKGSKNSPKLSPDEEVALKQSTEKLAEIGVEVITSAYSGIAGYFLRPQGKEERELLKFTKGEKDSLKTPLSEVLLKHRLALSPEVQFVMLFATIGFAKYSVAKAEISYKRKFEESQREIEALRKELYEAKGYEIL